MAKFDVDVELTDVDGNAFSVMGAVTKTMRRNGISQTDIDEYKKEAMSGDYDHLLRVTMETVNVS